MTYHGTFRGTGRIIVQDVDIGGATYEIHVYRDDIPAGSFQTPGATLPGLKEARGEIEADPSVIGQVNAARMAILQIESGESIQFFIGRWDYISRNADITVTGAIPGHRRGLDVAMRIVLHVLFWTRSGRWWRLASSAPRA